MSLVSLSDWFTEASKFSPAPSSDLLILYFQAARDSRVVGDAVFRALSLGWIYFLTLREYLINLEVEKSLRIASFAKIFLCTAQPGVGS